MKTWKYLLIFNIVAAPFAFAGDFTLVPNVGTVNGPTLQVTGAIGGTALFTATNIPGTGTGNFQPFLRLQQLNGQTTVETAYNSNNITDDAKMPVNFTHDLPFSSLATVTISGTDYFQFYLDMAQSGASPTIDLTRFDLGIGPASQSVVGATTAPTFTSLNWSLGGSGTFLHDINMTDVNAGNGQADVIIDIPTSAFAGITSGNVILYVQFTNANSSFEEFGTAAGNVIGVPESGMTLTWLGAAFALIDVARRVGAKVAQRKQCRNYFQLATPRT